MKKVKWLAGLALLLAVAVGAPIAAHYLADRQSGWVQVNYIYDGDTIAVDGPDGQVRVRLIGVDAPEIAHAQDKSAAQPYGEAAKAALAAHLPLGSRVRLEYDGQRYDQYGRTLAYVWDEERQMVNIWLVENGWAKEKHYKPNLGHREEILRAQQRAQRAGLGLWSGQAE